MTIHSPRLMRAALAAATIVTLGAPSAFAAQKNQNARVRARSNTSVISVQDSRVSNETNIDQDGGRNANQSARVRNRAVNETNSDIDASSENVIVVNQE